MDSFSSLFSQTTHNYTFRSGHLASSDITILTTSHQDDSELSDHLHLEASLPTDSVHRPSMNSSMCDDNVCAQLMCAVDKEMAIDAMNHGQSTNLAPLSEAVKPVSSMTMNLEICRAEQETCITQPTVAPPAPSTLQLPVSPASKGNFRDNLPHTQLARNMTDAPQTELFASPLPANREARHTFAPFQWFNVGPLEDSAPGNKCHPVDRSKAGSVGAMKEAKEKSIQDYPIMEATHEHPKEPKNVVCEMEMNGHNLDAARDEQDDEDAEEAVYSPDHDKPASSGPIIVEGLPEASSSNQPSTGFALRPSLPQDWSFFSSSKM
ncbi:unnamed protein product [Protopolystoma xenopodis]|uniref:Uncharacterized protein n=1 Tax=Protopolystoma xenopodis TaxID=117903 RepID=A0A3S5BN88_9PLAT|nr:unnamed protein product [Protopolystoma xenopodis]